MFIRRVTDVKADPISQNPTVPKHFFVLSLFASLALAGCGGDPSSDAQTTDSATPAASAQPSAQSSADANSQDGPQDDPADALALEPNGTSSGTASLVMAGESFSFSLQFCSINDTDALAHGPGQGNESGEGVYLNVDFTEYDGSVTGGLRVDFGATSQFQSSENFYGFTTEYYAGDYSLETSAGELTLAADIRFRGEDNLGPGTLTVHCG